MTNKLQNIAEKNKDVLINNDKTYRTIFNAVKDGMIFTEHNSGTILDVNTAWIRATGITRKQACGRTLLELELWANLADFDACRTKMGKKGRVVDFKASLMIKSVALPYLISGEIIEMGGKNYALWQFNDISEQIHITDELKNEEEKIKSLLSASEKSQKVLLNILEDEKLAREAQHESETRLKYISNNLTAGMIYQIIVPPDGSRKITYLSDSVRQLYGISPEEGYADASLIYNRVHEDDVEELVKAENEAVKTLTTFKKEVRMIDPSGEIRWSSFVSTPTLLEDGFTRWDGIEFIITDRKKAEHALIESELKYRSLFKAMGQGFYLSQILYNEEGHPFDYRYIDINSAFEQIIGLKKEEIIGKTYNELVPPDPESGWLDCFKRVARTGIPENYNFSSNIYNRYFEVYAFKPENDKFAALVKDITESKQIEEQIRTTLAEKETLLRELYHRTKNNMAVIIALLALQADFINDPHLTEAFKEAQNRIRSMALVHQKLYETQDLSRINLREYIDDLVALLFKSYKVSPSKITIASEMENMLVLIDTAIPCGLIINELISNSLKHAFPNGREGEIKIQLHKIENDIIQLGVTDNGIGIQEGLDFRKDGRLGLQSVFSLGETQLHGKITLKANPGVTFQLQFTDNLYKPRV